MDADAGVSLRDVKLKILYTFDSEHKNNHLARWPHVLEVQAAQLDEATVIGCIDLRTCLEAVTTASPELASNSDNDYTIYAYDYSEPDTPLVGQGMLSKALGHDGNLESVTETLITGRITKSVMGLFSKNAQETLEVKLRFTPVAGNGFRRRSGSVSSNSDSVQQQWNSLSQSNGSFRPASPMDTTGLEAMQRMLSESGQPRERSGSVYGDTSYHQAHSRPTSRSGTPAHAQHSQSQARQSGPYSRPASRAGTRPAAHARRDSFNSGYYSGEEVVEDGPARKRAKVHKVDSTGKSNFNIERQTESLRVAASTASSVRLHRPVPLNPATAALQNSNAGEEGVRPPTPIPAHTKTGKPRGRPRKVVSANLLRGPKARASSPIGHAQQHPRETSYSSPEDTRADSITSTPADLPSSPPVMPETQNFITSPQLPPLMNEADSGFMSGNFDDLFGDEAALLDFNDFINDKPEDGQHTDRDVHQKNGVEPVLQNGKDFLANLPTVFDDGNDTERSMAEMVPPPPKSTSAPTLTHAHSFTANHRTLVPAPRLAPSLAPKSGQTFEETRAQSMYPQIPASDPVGRSLHRANTWAPDMSDAIMSDIVTSDEQARGRPKKRVGKEQTKARLVNAIAQGEMPPFCDNCGAIETPAWRRAYTKIFNCPWDELETSLEPGECCYKEPLERDAEGGIIKFKGYKSERRQDERPSDGWTQICLCNPCGLWFHKSKFPRPPEKWQKKDPNEKKKRKRGPKSKKRPSAPRQTTKSDAPTPASDDSSPADTSAEGNDADDAFDGTNGNDEEMNDANEPELPPMPRGTRSGSAEPIDRSSRFNNMYHGRPVMRQVKSSPARPGNTRMDAIEIDLTPRPVQRQLFPSPTSLKNKSNAAIAHTTTNSSEQLPSFVRRSPRLNKVRDIFATPLESAALITVDGTDKENVAPSTIHSDSLADLFDSGFNEIMPPPTTPKRRSERLLFKTPGKTPSRDFGDAMSPNVQRTPTTRTPKVLHPVASILLNTAQRTVDPSQMTPFTRSIREALSSNVQPFELPNTPKANSSGRSTKTPRKGGAKEDDHGFDFPDLPSLKDSSPMAADPVLAFDFSELTTDRLQTDYHDVFSTDVAMPSSPPNGYFAFMQGKDDHNDFWADIALQADSDNVKAHVETSTGGLRRSPRKHTS